jgi:hypothetical protein
MRWLSKSVHIAKEEVVDFENWTRMLKIKIVRCGQPGYKIVSSFKAYILQGMAHLSALQLARFLPENNAAKLFCG